MTLVGGKGFRKTSHDIVNLLRCLCQWVSPGCTSNNSECNEQRGQSLLSLGDTRPVSKKGGFGECALVPVSFRGNMRTCPCSGFRSGGTSACTLVLVFVPGEHPPKPPFWKPPCF